jgi:hypothetical protein
MTHSLYVLAALILPGMITVIIGGGLWLLITGQPRTIAGEPIEYEPIEHGPFEP